MRLYFHADSDSLFWDEFCSDPYTDDVTDEPRFRHAAKLRGIKEPPEVTSVLNAEPKKTFTMADAITQSYKTWERKPADIYPTPVDATESIIDVIKVMSKKFEEEHGRPIKTIWEPACGDGRLARVLEHHGYTVIATDLREYSGYGQGGLDFLNEDPLKKWGWDIGEIDLIVTNPPFSLSVEFVRKALSITPYCIMLVKQSYYNTANRYDFFSELRPTLFLPITWRLAFLEEERGKSPLMDCAWLIWAGEKQSDSCAFEPIKRKKYPGYARKGIKASMRILEGEFDALANALQGFKLKDG